MKLETQCLFQNNILENRPSNREKKKFRDSKHQNDLSKNAFRISLKGALGVHQFISQKQNLSLELTALFLL